MIENQNQSDGDGLRVGKGHESASGGHDGVTIGVACLATGVGFLCGKGLDVSGVLLAEQVGETGASWGASGLGVGSTKIQVSLTIGGGAGSFSTLSIIFGGGFLGCSVTLSMICCGCLLTTTLSMTSPGGVGFLFTSRLTTGGGVGSLTLSTFLLGGETLHSDFGGSGVGVLNAEGRGHDDVGSGWGDTGLGVLAAADERRRRHDWAVGGGEAQDIISLENYFY